MANAFVPAAALVLAVSAAVPSGCATVPEETLEGPYATEGFSDGCRSAEARQAAFSTKVYRNDELFRLQPSYAAGWRQGYNECLAKTNNTGLEPTNLGEPRSLP